MKRKLLSFLTAALLLLPALTTAASPGFVCDNCDYEASSYAQRDITVQKDGGTIKIREYYCPGCNTVFSSVEVPDSYQNTPKEDEEEKPAPSSNESKETDPPKAREEATVDTTINTNTNTNTTTNTNTNTNTNTDNNTNTNPDTDPAIQIVHQTPEQLRTGKTETTTVTAVAATDVQPEEPAKEEAAIVYVQPEQPVSNTKTTENAEPEKPVTGTFSDPEPVQPAPEQPVRQSGSDEALSLVPEKPAEEENAQAVTYAEPPAPAADPEGPAAPPEEPVPKIRNHPECAGAELTTEAPIVLETEKPDEPAEAPPMQQLPQPQAELTAPPAPEVTLPPVIAEQPTETPPPTEPPTITPTPKPRTSSITTTEKYPAFSRFFPARRLHLKGDPEARAPRAGTKIWPEEPGMSLLERMLNADP